MSLDKSQVLGVVLAHGDAAPSVRRHLPLWQKVCGEILVVVPEDQCFDLGDGVPVVETVPNGGKYSTETNRRAANALRIAQGAAKEIPLVMLLEWDSLVWGPIPLHAVPEWGSMAATKFPAEPRSPIHPRTFAGSFYLHFPHLYTRLALDLVLGTIDQNIPLDAEHGYTDRFLGLAVEKAGVPVLDWRAKGLSFSWENISAHPERVAACRQAVQRGALFSHGIKDEASLRQILPVSAWGKA